MAKSPEGAKAIVDADVFDVFPQLLNSRDAKVREWTAEIMRTLATHGFVFEQSPRHSLTASSGSMIDGLVSPSRVPLKYAHTFR
jgi:hypothetical protein